MSIAYKCDRCGKLYSEKIQNYNSKLMIVSCSTNGNRYDHSADLCNECFDSFMEWWNKRLGVKEIIKEGTEEDKED